MFTVVAYGVTYVQLAGSEPFTEDREISRLNAVSIIEHLDHLQATSSEIHLKQVKGMLHSECDLAW